MHMRVDVVWGYPAPKVMSMTPVLQFLGMCHVSTGHTDFLLPADTEIPHYS